MINYNISGILIDCVELDELDQNYLYHASLMKFFPQSSSCILLNRIKHKVSSSIFRLLNLYHRYTKGKYNKFEHKFIDSIVQVEDLNKEISNNNYALININKLSYAAQLSLWELKEEYQNNNPEINNKFEESHFFSDLIGVFSGIFLLTNGIELGINRAIYIHEVATFLLFPPVHIFESWKNHPQTVIDQVSKDISYVFSLIGEIESFEAFSINSEKFIELVD
jgi:hypothetical protein